MCGLVGIAGNISNTKHGKMFRNLLILDSVRGVDSTGIAVATLNKPTVIEKDIGPPSNLWDYNTSKVFSFSGNILGNPKVLMGHNRYATTGKVTVDNAHPFQYGKIVGCHNGTLTEWRDLEGYKTTDVDSKALINTIDIKGIDHCWKSFRGAAALTFWDEEKHTINLIRNKDRPLHVCMSKDGKTLFWASEEWMITISAIRAGVELEKKIESQASGVFQLAENYLHSYKISNGDIILEEVRELEKKPEPVYPIGNMTHFGFKGSKRNFKKLVDKINFGWASKLERAPKELKNVKFILSYGVKPYDEYSEVEPWIIVGNLLNDNDEVVRNTRIEVAPDIVEDFLTLEREAGNLSKVYETTARPRFLKPLDSINNRLRIRISDKCIRFSHDRVAKASVEFDEKFAEIITLVNKQFNVKNVSSGNVVNLKNERKFLGRSGKYIPEGIWWEELCDVDPQCCCTACGNPISTDDHLDLIWMDKSVVCKTCQDDPTIMQYLKYN